MKRKLAIVSLAVIALVALIVALIWSPPARAASTYDTNTYSNVTQLNGGGFSVAISNAAAFANFATNTLQFGRANNISVQLVCSNAAANTSNTFVFIQRSVDGVNFYGGYSMQLANGGTVTKNVISNFTALGDIYWRFFTTNGCDTAQGTNFIYIRVGAKDGI